LRLTVGEDQKKTRLDQTVPASGRSKGPTIMTTITKTTFSYRAVATLLGMTALGALSIISAIAKDLDPVETDGDKYKVRFENEQIRVLEYTDMPDTKTQEHHHPAFFLYALEPFRRKITLSGGKTIMREFKAGDVMWSQGQTHAGENVGTTPTHVLMVEMK
jgi:beta-alanine degradation protein BauB